MKKFAGMSAKDYRFFDKKGNTRHVVALYTGGNRAGFIEYENARQFVDRIHDLCDLHEAELREAARNE